MEVAPCPTLTFARHGESRRPEIVGEPEEYRGLSDLGRDQGHQLATELAAEHEIQPYTDLYASPLPRAHETALIVAHRLDLPVTVHQGLRDPDYGQAQGRRWDEVMALSTGSPIDGLDYRLAEGAETWREYWIRATAALTAIIEHSGGQVGTGRGGCRAGRNVIVIGHRETAAVAALLLQGLTAEDSVRVDYDLAHAGFSRWQYRPVRGSRSHYCWALLGSNKRPASRAAPAGRS
ncbi:histidine phosphatase family protein [Amycolatopsis pigmentata]|uniref:Histidine phosphatase family protein n=1 Tax=Amycolatopsis pigmentata TaxID=450801 RepID=A0ABW5G3H7_9PSEU